MLKSIQLTNFKSFASEPQTIPFAPVTVFVGANGSGKSNVFDAIRFLQGFGSGLSVGEILSGKWEGGREVFPGIRGGVSEICWSDKKSFRVRTSHEVKDDLKFHWAHDIATSENYQTATEETLYPSPIQLLHDLEISLCEGAQVDLETLHQIENKNTRIPIIEAVRKNPDFDSNATLSLGNRRADNTDKTRFDRNLLRMGLNTSLNDPWRIRAMIEDFVTAYLLEMHPADMRDYVAEDKKEIGDRGQNLSAILSQICYDSLDKQRLIEWISSLCSPPIVDIEFDKTKLGDVLVQLVEEGGQAISARSLSDGTLRFMGLLAALFSVPEGTIILLEEIENGLHPTRVHLLMELLEEFAAERNLQIIATTHSSQVLLGLSEKALHDVVLFARDEEHPGTIVRRLGELEHFDEVTQKTQVDELFTTGWLEFAV